jgi:excisionase family DNA binding protein
MIKNADVLNGLPEIANYLDVTDRTVLRWEKKHSLPLHRPAGTGKTYAYKSELEKWRRGELQNGAK